MNIVSRISSALSLIAGLGIVRTFSIKAPASCGLTYTSYPRIASMACRRDVIAAGLDSTRSLSKFSPMPVSKVPAHASRTISL